ncbi:MAG: heavy metal-responsive transcriptional regulator [Actinomycetota bacterium]
MRVSDLASAAGVSPDTVRYYERVGLLPRPGRTTSGYREYEDAAVSRLHFIKGAQGLGLRLTEIRDLLEIQDRGACPCGHTRDLVRMRVSEIDAEIRRLELLRCELGELEALECPSPEGQGGWPCQTRFIEKGGAAGG